MSLAASLPSEPPTRVSVTQSPEALHLVLAGTPVPGVLLLCITGVVYGSAVAIGFTALADGMLGSQLAMMLAVMAVLGTLSLHAGLCMLVNKTRITVDPKSISIRVGPIPQRAARRFDATNIAQIYVASYQTPRKFRGLVDLHMLKLDTLDYAEEVILPASEDEHEVTWIGSAIATYLQIPATYPQ